MKRTSQIPYEEISLLSLTSITPGTKFQLLGKIKDQKEDYILLSDDKNTVNFSTEINNSPDIEIGEVVLVFGQKEEEEAKLEKVIKMDLDWSLLIKTKALEEL